MILPVCQHDRMQSFGRFGDRLAGQCDPAVRLHSSVGFLGVIDAKVHHGWVSCQAEKVIQHQTFTQAGSSFHILRIGKTASDDPANGRNGYAAIRHQSRRGG